jgi:hypothetical protein
MLKELDSLGSCCNGTTCLVMLWWPAFKSELSLGRCHVFFLRHTSLQDNNHTQVMIEIIPLMVLDQQEFILEQERAFIKLLYKINHNS